MSHERHFENEVIRLLKEISHNTRKHPLNNSIRITIPNQQGENMGAPQTLTVGAGSVTAVVVESLNGVPSTTFNGPLAFASDNPAFATVDPALGVVTPVAPGLANISVTDAIGNLTDSSAVTVVAAAPPPPQPNNGISISIPAQSANLVGSAHAKK
jgi:uncharacterized protein YjdB